MWLPKVDLCHLLKRHHKEPPKAESEKWKNVVIPYVAGLSEKFRRLFQKTQNSSSLKLHPKDKTVGMFYPTHMLCVCIYRSMHRRVLWPVYKWNQALPQMYGKHRRAPLLGQDSAVDFHPKEKSRSFEDSNVQVLDQEDRWLERRVKTPSMSTWRNLLWTGVMD